MIISHKYKFIYIKTIKTASTSIEAYLSSICGPDDVITPASEKLMEYREGQRAQNWRLDHPAVPKRKLWRRILRRPERRYHPTVGYYEHMPAWRVRTYVGEEIWNDYYKFTFERNPWDRQVSYYFFKTKSLDDRPPFEKFMGSKKRAYINNFDLYSADDEIILDKVGRFESLETEFGAIVDRLGLENYDGLIKSNSHSDKSKSYREYFNDETNQIILDWYSREIDEFGYEF